ncbi:GNAT family N-acetyltransferase [uncultured Duncaniella sp.]|uniref:GNAT family N-acetyltransferase n=1 Tax=uncultured Duncaniella sp. TaxID=2768039 RepID=UPI00259AE497|nr:GNAT family N-acetyltransferase [uncultured Duncaniella sp.]
MNFEEFYRDYGIRKLDLKEYITAFSCGDDDLDDFILNDAPLYREALLAVTYIIERNSDKKVVGYFSLANDRITIKDFPSNNEFNKFRKHRFVNEKRLTNYPSVKLCRFALSNDIRGKHVGSILLDFMKRYFVSDNKTGCRFMTVDAYRTAEEFYLKNGFLYLNSTDSEKPTRLMFYDLINLED